MARVITFSRVFPAYHPKKGEPTYFKEALQGSLYNSGYDLSGFISYPDTHMKNNEWSKTPKNHTVRSGNRWKVGDKFSPRVWSGKPYASKMITIAPDVEIKKIWEIEINFLSRPYFKVNGVGMSDSLIDQIAKNDGLSYEDMRAWFAKGYFKGQIICWSDSVNY